MIILSTPLRYVIGVILPQRLFTQAPAPLQKTGLALSKSQTMSVPHMADGFQVKPQSYTSDVGILFASLSVGFGYILIHQDILMSA